MSERDAYAGIVDLYDLEHDGFRDDVELLIQLAEIGDGPILELGCGTGRVLIPLAEAGHRIIGIDSSAPMLVRLRERLQACGENVSAEVHLGDMADLSAVPGGPFGLVVASINSLYHLPDQDEQRRALSSAYAALAPGGRMVIDVFNPGLAQLNHLLNTTHLEGTWTNADGTIVDKWGHRQPGNDAQSIDTLIWYDAVTQDGSVRRVRTRFTLRYLHQSELALLLEIVGFAHTDWYGSYELDPWDAESDRIIAVAHKD